MQDVSYHQRLNALRLYSLQRRTRQSYSDLYLEDFGKSSAKLYIKSAHNIYLNASGHCTYCEKEVWQYF